MVDVDATALFLVDVDQTALFQPVDGRRSSTSVDMSTWVDVHFIALFITPCKKPFQLFRHRPDRCQDRSDRHHQHRLQQVCL